MTTHLSFLASVALLFLVSIVETSAQPALTAEGYGKVNWGSSLSDAVSALPDFYEAEFTANERMNYRIPCDKTLAAKTDYGDVSLLFYDGKFIAVRRDVKLSPLPDGVSKHDVESFVTNLLRDSLTSKNEDKSADPLELDIRLGSLDNSGTNFTVLIVHKPLEQEALSKRDAGIDRSRAAFLEGLAEKILKP
jgi:hypothetical protein